MRKVVFLLMLSLASFQVFGRSVTVLGKSQAQVFKRINKKLNLLQGEFAVETAFMKSNSTYSNDLEQIVLMHSKQSLSFSEWVLSFFIGIDKDKYPLMWYRAKLTNSMKVLSDSIAAEKIKVLRNTDEGILLVEKVRDFLNSLQKINQCIISGSSTYRAEESVYCSAFKTINRFYSFIASVAFVIVTVFCISLTVYSFLSSSPDAGWWIIIAPLIYFYSIPCIFMFRVSTYALSYILYDDADVYKKDPVII
jgi:hypothetical protein